MNGRLGFQHTKYLSIPFGLTNTPAVQPADSLSFLGYVNNPNQIHMDLEKDCAVANWPASDNQKIFNDTLLTN